MSEESLFADLSQCTCIDITPREILCEVCELDVNRRHHEICSSCIHNLLCRFKEKEQFCKINGDPLTQLVAMVNEHTKILNTLCNHLQIQLVPEAAPSDVRTV